MHPLGATVLSWIPKGQRDVLYVSPRATTTPGRAIRGGIPICAPWFAAHPTESSWPSHGVARTRVWNVESHRTNQVVLTLSSSADTLESWPFPFLFRYTVTLSDRLEMRFEHHNPHSGPVQTGGALHTYLAVSDLSAVGIPALDPLARLDKLTQQVVRSGPVRAASPIDAVFYDAPQQLQVQTGDRVVQLQQNAPDAVVWNPGADKAASMGDLGEGEHAHFVCVEAAAVRLRSLAPGATFHLRTTLSLPC